MDKTGVITNAIWSRFSKEMISIRDKVDLEIAEKYLNEEESAIFTEGVKPSDLPVTLKREMLYILYGMEDGKNPRDYDAEDLNFLTNHEGVLRGYHYVSAEVEGSGKSKKYIYDEERDVIFKVDGTYILGTTIHTYEYGCKLKGLPYRNIATNDYIISDTSPIIFNEEIAYYAPDLENFKSSTISLVYYEKDNMNNSREVPYIIAGGSKEIQSNEINYIWHDYSVGSKVWANIKSESKNGVISYWVWIPRYAYKIDGENVDIKYVNLQNEYYDGDSKAWKSLEDGYLLAAAFNQDSELKGIWMSKYNASMYNLGFTPSTEPSAVNPPDLSNFNESKTYYITYDESGNEIATPITEPAPGGWYDYTTKKWANIKCVNSDNEDGKELVSYWVWIPRYAWREEQGQVEIIFVNSNNEILDDKYEGLFTVGPDDTYDFKVLEGFDQGGKALNGIWMSKYNASYERITVPEAGIEESFKLSEDTSAVNEPDLEGFDRESTYYITYDESGNETAIALTEDTPSNWYDYTNKKWANIKTTANNLTSYWVWIPRYAYRVKQGQVEIIYVDTNNKPLDSRYDGYDIGAYDSSSVFRVAGAFSQNDTELSGIWVSKYNASYVSNEYQLSTDIAAVNAPDMEGFATGTTTIGEVETNITQLVYYNPSDMSDYKLVGYTGGDVSQTYTPEGSSTTYYLYDYTTKKIWANIVTQNDGITAWWTWIPRYAYRVTQGQVEIIFVDENNKPLDEQYNSYTIGTDETCDFRVLETFNQGGNSLKGIWMSKYNSSQLEISE